VRNGPLPRRCRCGRKSEIELWTKVIKTAGIKPE
jgi:hypothetical protein